MSTNLAKCSCSHCDGHLEFDTAYAGERIACPHCGKETLLYIPGTASAPPTPSPAPPPTNPAVEAAYWLTDSTGPRTPPPQRTAAPPLPPPQPSLPQICWSIAYIILPRYAFEEFDHFVDVCTHRVFTSTSEAVDPAGAYFYFIACNTFKFPSTQEAAVLFRVHQGQLDEARDYFVLEYPTPPPINMSDTDLARLSPEHRPVLAPYFSIVVRHRQTAAVSYYALGQSPTGGTTLRSVALDGTNSNHGPGPEPTLDAFLVVLRRSGGKLRTYASWKR
jgi:hypothetical protein